MRTFLSAAVLLPLCVAQITMAAVQPAGIFADSMVLQQSMRVPIWGWAAVGEVVTITFNGQTVTATARDSTVAVYKGYWKAWLNSMSAGGPYDMTISGSQSTAITLHGLLVGDVWVCSGQSNMWYTFNGMYYTATSPEVEALPPEGSPITQIRMCTIGASRSLNPALDLQQNPAWSNMDNEVTAPWRSCSHDAALDFSACAGDFAVTVYAATHVPLGMILAAVGATGLRMWVPPDLADTIWYRQCNNYADSAIAHPAPVRYTTNQSNTAPGGCYAGLINPLVGMAIKGVIWWQGENESENQDAVCDYTTGGFRELIRSWRAHWGQGNFPFLYVQMQQSMDGNATENVVEVRDQQLQCLTEPNTGMAVSFDSAVDIHPGKYVPSIRLAKAAIELVYGQNIEGMGPIYSGMTIAGNTATIKFVHTGAGLAKHDLVWFEGDNSLAVGTNVISSSNDTNAPFLIAGADNVYHPADATINGTTVVVSSPAVSAPKNVHYAMEIPNRAKTPLYNTANLPASMFRTDTWGGYTGTSAFDYSGSRFMASSGKNLTIATSDGRIKLPQAMRSSSTTVELFDIRGELIAKTTAGSNGVVRPAMVGRQTLVARIHSN